LATLSSSSINRIVFISLGLSISKDILIWVAKQLEGIRMLLES
jgi:hypothetical protein